MVTFPHDCAARCGPWACAGAARRAPLLSVCRLRVGKLGTSPPLLPRLWAKRVRFTGFPRRVLPCFPTMVALACAQMMIFK